MIYIVGENLGASELLGHLFSYKGVVGLDTETSGINPRKQASACGAGRIECWSLSTEKYEKVFLWSDQLEPFTPWLQSDKHKKVGHNIYGFDYHMFANHGITLAGIAADTMIMSRLLYCSKERSHSLKALSQNWLGIHQPSFDSLFRRPKHEIRFIQESRKVKGVVEDLSERHTKRKVGPHKGVPTLLVTGERGFFGKALEYIPLSDIPALYPDRLGALYEYASTDAYLTRLLYYKFKQELTKVPWSTQK